MMKLDKKLSKHELTLAVTILHLNTLGSARDHNDNC
jgi:hypothetical protein